MYTEIMKYFLLLTLAIVGHNCEEDSKFGKNNRDEVAAYRSRKASLVWLKATKVLKDDPDALAELKLLLTPIDEQLYKLKKIKYEGLDPFGEQENTLNEKLDGILGKFGLKKFFPSEFTHNPAPGAKDADPEHSRLDAIYNKAAALGFTPDELRDLESEISHHRRKLAEMRVHKEQVSQLETDIAETSENAVHVNPQEQKARRIDLKHKMIDLKERQKELSDSLGRLNSVLDTTKRSDIQFTHEKVIQLWGSMVKANFSNEELYSMKEELSHLEQKLYKKETIAESVSEIEKRQMTNRHLNDDIKLNEKQEFLKQRADELTKQVDKHVNSIEKMVRQKLHDEL